LSRFLIACVILPVGLLLARAQAANGDDLVHTVSAGDTLISIAHAYGVTLDQLLNLNGIDPEALLQIGQRLIVIPASELAADEGAGASEDEGGAAAVDAPGPVVEAEEWPPAPVLNADAPMRDPADLSARLCAAVYQDDNRNGLKEPGEKLLPDATIRLLDADGRPRLEYKTDGQTEPHCLDQLERQIYQLDAIAPPGFGLTGAASLSVDLRSGGLARVNFGAIRGLETAALAPSAETRAPEPSVAEPGRSLLRELSGLFVLGLAATVFFSGLAVSLFLRGR